MLNVPFFGQQSFIETLISNHGRYTVLRQKMNDFENFFLKSNINDISLNNFIRASHQSKHFHLSFGLNLLRK